MRDKHSNVFIFSMIVLTVGVTTLCHGLMVPLLSSLEVGQFSIGFNSISTSTIYFGLLFSMIFMEQVLKKIGFRNCIIFGLGLGIVSILLFLVYETIFTGLVYRFLLGISLGAVHYATQTWIGIITKQHNRGKMLATYGFSTGVGFAIGPIGLNTLTWSDWLPFVIAATALFIALLFVLRLPNHRPEEPNSFPKTRNTKVSRSIFITAFPALFMCFVYGYMEASLNGGLPIFAYHEHLSVSVVSLSLSLFVIGSLIFQFPLGHASDTWGRRNILLLCSLVGSVVFVVIPFVVHYPSLFIAMFIIVGGLLGTLFSLSLAYLNDLVPAKWLPFGNRLAIICFGSGLVLGPINSALFMQFLSMNGLFFSIAFLFLLYFTYSMLSLCSTTEKNQPTKNE